MEIRKLKLEELNRIDLNTYKSINKNSIIVILDNVRSMNNVGSVFRTCDAFKINEIILTGITPIPPHREIQKTALGATESVDWKYEENISNIIINLKKLDWVVFGIEQTNKSVFLNEINFISFNKIVVIFGNEIDGLSNNVLNLVDFFIEIPQFGTKHSLNISVCVGIVLWDIINKKKYFNF